MALGNSKYNLKAQYTISDAPKDYHGIYAKDDNEELIYEILVLKNKDPKNRSLMSISITVVDAIGLVKPRRHLKVLFDPSLTRTMIKSSTLPSKAVPIK